MIYSPKFWILLFVVSQVASSPQKFNGRPSSSNNFAGVEDKENRREHLPTDIEPHKDQTCAGRNYQGRRCCTPDNPCDEGEGDCDGAIDGGVNDGDTGCKGNLVCGSNNCKQFGAYYHEKDDCCEKPSGPITTTTAPPPPPPGQRCTGRYHSGKRCCTPENPCGEGEGDCDGPLDGGQHDGDLGCIGDLVCGSNNCKKFGNFYHPKDDCCEKPSGQIPNKSPLPQIPGQDGWTAWGEFSQCSKTCGVGAKTRTRFCLGSGCTHERQDQSRACKISNC